MNRLLSLWRTESKTLPTSVDCIVALSYATKRQRLTKCSRIAVLTAIQFAEKFPDAYIAFASSEHCYPGSERFEEHEKLKLLAEAGIPAAKIITGGGISNTVQEAAAVRDALERNNISIRRILVITGEMHSRSARFVWVKTCSDSEIFVKCFPFKDEYESDHPFFLARSAVMWVIANFGRQIFLRTLGLAFTSRIKHHSREFDNPIV